ncbi:MAG: hypothetical protein IJK24_04760 [Oscillospiraceae bacterium]|nr:hypothetical protein [Oscillospiraceae bacterium]
MKQNRIAYTVSRKNPLVWLSALLALAALAGFLLRARQLCGTERCWALWFQALLPALAALFFAYQLLVRGKDRSYRLSLPFWVLTASLLFAAWSALPWYWALLVTLAALAAAWLVHRALAGTIALPWLPCLLAGLWLIALLCFWFFLQETKTEGVSLLLWLQMLAEALLLLAYLPLCLALRKVKDGKYHPTWGDRNDGRKIRSLSPISVVGTYIMPERNQANVFFQDKLEITALEKYIRDKRAKGLENFGMTEALLAAYVRTLSKYPGINRFISGEKIFSRGEDIQFCMTVKKEMNKESPDTVLKVHLKTGDSVETVYQKFHQALADAKKSMELDSSLDGTAALFGMVPGVVLKFVVWLLKLLDYFGLLPKAILEVSPFHGSIFFTSMGSLGIPAVFHHLYNFGNLPLFLAFGRKFRVNETDDSGQAVSRKYMDYTFNVDERIVDGFYYAAAIKFFHKLLLRPERLDDPEMEINEDIP